MTDRTYRIAHLADTHLGYRALRDRKMTDGGNARQADVRQSFMAAIYQITEEHYRRPIDLFVHAGDIFDHPRPNLADVTLVAQAINTLADRGIPQVWIAGNHDVSPLPTGGTTLGVLDAAFTTRPVIAIYHHPERFVFDAGEIQVDCYPHGAARIDRTEPLPRLHGTTSRILLAHGEVTTAGLLEQGSRSEQLTEPYDYVALGHIHKPERKMTFVGPAYQPGAIEHYGWRDAGFPTQWLLVTIDHRPGEETVTTEERAIPHRPMIDLGTIPMEVHDRDATKAIAEIRRRLEEQLPPSTEFRKEPMVRVNLEGLRELSGEARRAIQQQHFPDIWHLQIDTTSLERPWRHSGAREMEARGAGFNLAAIFTEFLAERAEELGAEFAERFKAAGLEALADAAAADLARTVE